MLKKKLLLTGMGCFLCYGALTFLNVTLLPYARACYGYGAPLMLLSLVGVMESIDDDLILAARTLGCGPVKSFAKVVLPLSVSGLLTGSMLVFTGTVTAYATPSLLGGSKTKVLSTLLYQYAYNMNDWLSAAMVAGVMIVITIALNVAITYAAKRLNKGGVQ